MQAEDNEIKERIARLREGLVEVAAVFHELDNYAHDNGENDSKDSGDDTPGKVAMPLSMSTVTSSDESTSEGETLETAKPQVRTNEIQTRKPVCRHQTNSTLRPDTMFYGGSGYSLLPNRLSLPPGTVDMDKSAAEWKLGRSKSALQIPSPSPRPHSSPNPRSRFFKFGFKKSHSDHGLQLPEVIQNDYAENALDASETK